MMSAANDILCYSGIVTSPMKVFAVSDLHVDYRENLDWIDSLSRDRYREDVLLLAGDVTDDLRLLGSTLRALKSRFAEVLFVPGNHELWVDGGEFSCSLEKFDAVMSLCSHEGIRTGVYTKGCVSIVPLLGWYDFSFGQPDAFLQRAWRDFRACRWPAEFDSQAKICDFFLRQNDRYLSTDNVHVISFSHFLPRLDVMPAAIPEHRRKVYPVLGSARLDHQIRKLQPAIHVYGHSHVNQAIEIDGIRYMNNAYATPKEARIARKELVCIFDTEAVPSVLAGENRREPA